MSKDEIRLSEQNVDDYLTLIHSIAKKEGRLVEAQEQLKLRWGNFSDKEIEELENALYFSYNEDAGLEMEEVRKLLTELYTEFVRRGLRDPEEVE